MTTVLSSPPQATGITFRIQPDGSLIPSDMPSSGPSGLGLLTLVVSNYGTAVSDLGGLAAVAAFIQANAAFPLPFARYYIDWQALRTAAGQGKAYAASTF